MLSPSLCGNRGAQGKVIPATPERDVVAAPGSVTIDYAYSQDHQRSSATSRDSSFVARGLPAASPTYVPNAVNQYGTVGGTTYAYDTRGNLTSHGVWTFSHDTENHLLSASKTGTTVAYTYDPLGRRRSKTVNGELVFVTGFGSVSGRWAGQKGLSRPASVAAALEKRRRWPEMALPSQAAPAAGGKRSLRAKGWKVRMPLLSGTDVIRDGRSALPKKGTVSLSICPSHTEVRHRHGHPEQHEGRALTLE